MYEFVKGGEEKLPFCLHLLIIPLFASLKLRLAQTQAMNKAKTKQCFLKCDRAPDVIDVAASG